MIAVNLGIVAVYRRVTAAWMQPASGIGQNLRGLMGYILGPQSLTSIFVNPATLATEIPVLNAIDRLRYTGHFIREEGLVDES